MSAVEEYLKHREFRLRNYPHDRDVDVHYADAALDEVRDENERLKVCGTCMWCNTQDQPECEAAMGMNRGGPWPGPFVSGKGWAIPSVGIDEACHFTPPRWTPYWAKP